MNFSGADIAAAFGRPNPDTRCGSCPHPRWEHRVEVTLDPGGNVFKGTEDHFECQAFDGRTKTGYCKCQQFVAFSAPEPSLDPDLVTLAKSVGATQQAGSFDPSSGTFVPFSDPKGN